MVWSSLGVDCAGSEEVLVVGSGGAVAAAVVPEAVEPTRTEPCTTLPSIKGCQTVPTSSFINSESTSGFIKRQDEMDPSATTSSGFIKLISFNFSLKRLLRNCAEWWFRGAVWSSTDQHSCLDDS